MELEFFLDRVAPRPTYTIGHLFSKKDNGKEYFCDTLEDTLRIPFFKIYGMTCIRAGRYKFTLEHDVRPEKHGALRPYLHNVQDFTGIEMHPGTTDLDSEGCILVGINKEVGKLLESRNTFDRFLKLLQDSKQTSWYITISNPINITTINQTEVRPHK